MYSGQDGLGGRAWDFAFNTVSRGWLVTQCVTRVPGLPYSDVLVTSA